MGHSSSFVVNDSELADKIEQRFHEYVSLFMQLHYPVGDKAVSDNERRALTSQIKEAVHEISLLAMKRKRCKFDTTPAKRRPYPVATASERSYRSISG